MKNENILICRYEDIYLSPHKLIKEICDFLDVQINNKMLGLSSSVINPTKTKKNIKDLINFSKTKECIELSENSINFLNDIYISDVEKLSKQEKFDFVNYADFSFLMIAVLSELESNFVSKTLFFTSSFSNDDLDITSRTFVQTKWSVRGIDNDFVISQP